MIDKPKGGRGKIAPYQSVTVRVPIPVKPKVDRIVENYRLSLSDSNLEIISESEALPIPLKNALIKVQEILGDKKANKKVTAKRILEAIYGQKITLEDT